MAAPLVVLHLTYFLGKSNTADVGHGALYGFLLFSKDAILEKKNSLSEYQFYLTSLHKYEFNFT